jgi:tRNA A37 N6-isopentenylltransferase MiaA
MDIVELLQREIQEHKMAWSKLKEENVALRGFKAIVMKDPKKYAHNNPPETLFDEERRKFREDQQIKQEELDRIKKDNNNLYTRVADALEVNEHHQKLNGKLQERVTELEQDNLELHADNKKLARQIEDKVDQMRKSGM